MVGYQQIGGSSLRCSRTGRPLQPGERFYSVLYERDGGFEREDISMEAWQGPPENAFSFWVSRVPDRQTPRRLTVDDDVLFDCFDRFETDGDASKDNFRYILALLLLRRKRLRFEDAQTRPDGEYMILRCSRSQKTYTIRSPDLTDDQIAEIQEQVWHTLGWRDG